MAYSYLLLGVGSVLLLLAARIAIGAQLRLRRRRRLAAGKLPRAAAGKRLRDTRVLAVLGSGGHTAEMLRLVGDVAGAARGAVTYVSADAACERRATNYSGAHGITASVVRVPRARHVGEPLWRAAPRAAACAARAVWVVARARPHVVLSNGPGTGCLVALAAVVTNALGLTAARVVYAESVARVRTLSLTGRLLYPFADRFLVQWPALARRYDAAEYHGRFS